MKESKAMKKMCPYLGQGLFSGILANKNVVDLSVDDYKAMDNLTVCHGSDCMMWEFDQRLEMEEKKVKTEEKLEDYGKHSSDGFRPSSIIGHHGMGHEHVTVRFIRYVDTDSGDCGLKISSNSGE